MTTGQRTTLTSAERENPTDTPSRAALFSAIELNQSEWLRHKRHLPWVQFNDDGDVLRVFTGDGWPRNFVGYAKFSPETASRRVKEILAPHLKAKVACNWLIGPLSEPRDLPRHLRAHGFHCMIHTAGMVCELNHAPQPPPAPDGVLIEHAHEPPCFVPLTTDLRRLRQKGRCLLLGTKPKQIWTFAATVAGKPVGQTTLFVSGGVAGIYDVEVIKEFRRRGIGTSLVAAALRQAKEFGLSLAILGASGMGESIYARLGFREVCKLSFWKYGKMRQLRGAP
jgi:GNAT superfamily N-acetyltransferase